MVDSDGGQESCIRLEWSQERDLYIDQQRMAYKDQVALEHNTANTWAHLGMRPIHLRPAFIVVATQTPLTALSNSELVDYPLPFQGVFGRITTKELKLPEHVSCLARLLKTRTLLRVLCNAWPCTKCLRHIQAHVAQVSVFIA